MWFFDLFDKKKQEARRRKNVERTATQLLDVTLDKDELWLCYAGELIAPMSILTDKSDINECMALVSVMRKLYVDRHL